MIRFGFSEAKADLTILQTIGAIIGGVSVVVLPLILKVVLLGLGV
jgi:hypothetical protein